MRILKYWQRSYYKRIYYKKTPWTQPTLTANGTAGGDSFAVSASAEGTGAQFHPAYNAFDNNSSTYWRSGTTTGWIQFYNPVPLLAQSIRWIYFYCYPTGGTVEGSNDGIAWDTVASWNNSAAADFDIQLTSNVGYKYHRINVTGVNKDVIHSYQLSITAETVSAGTAEDYDYYTDSAGTAEDYDYFVDTQVNAGDSYTYTTETEVANGNIGGNLMYGRRLFGRWIYAGSIKLAGAGGGETYTYLPDLYTVIAYAADGTKTAIFGAGAEENTIKKLTFNITETGCGSFEIVFSKLPTNAELDYRQRIDIFLFNDNRPWYSGYVLTRPIEGTTETEFKFSGHGYYNLLEKIMVFGTWSNVEVSNIVREIAQTAETKAGLVYNADKVINASYTIDTITFDGVTAKEALAELSDFAIDYVYGVDEKRSLYFKPRNTDINEEARFWVGKHVGGYVPSWDVEKIVNWAKIKGATVDVSGEQWLATVEDTTSQTTYGIQEAVWTLPSAYTAGDATRWGQNQINKYKDPIKSAKLTKINLEYPKADGTFSVRKLTTDGLMAIYPTAGDMQTYPITKLKYTISPDKGIQCEAEVGEQPITIDKYFAELDRKAKNAEMLQAASTKQLAT